MVKYIIIFMENSVTEEKIIHLQKCCLFDSDEYMNKLASLKI